LRAGKKSLPDPATNCQCHGYPYATREQKHQDEQEQATNEKNIHGIFEG
jgi:hypothetical protein